MRVIPAAGSDITHQVERGEGGEDDDRESVDFELKESFYTCVQSSLLMYI